VMTDPVRRAETYSVLARAQVSAGRSDEAIATIGQALAAADLPRTWRARMRALLAMLERAGTGDLDAADVTAGQALTAAQEAGDAFATAHALTGLWLSHGVRRDHAAALDDVDQALRVLGDDPGYADLRSFAVDGRIFTLQNLDRWPDAESTLRQARDSAQRSGSPDRTTWVTAAVLRYWLGQWDDALAELSTDEEDAPGLTYTFLRERWPALLVHGVAALIAGRRAPGPADDRRPAAARGPGSPRLAAPRPGEPGLPRRRARRGAGAARRDLCGHAGAGPDPAPARRRDDPDPPVAAGSRPARDHRRRPADRADRGAGLPGGGRDGNRPARATAASSRCLGLLESDPAPLRDAVAHYRAVGPAVELPAALERAGLHGTAAGWLAAHGHPVEAVRQARAARTGTWPPGCCRTTGSTFSSAAGAPPWSSW